MPPECPHCKQKVAALRISRGRRPRPELWWECPGCGWLGVQHSKDRPLRTMRRLDGDDADCVFCGEEESNIASEVWEQDGELRDWVVCLACGRSNPRRVGRGPN